MKHVYIIGAGGLGRELLNQVLGDQAHGRDWVVIGFIDTRKEKKGTTIDGLPVIGDENDVFITENTEFAVAVGYPDIKRQVVENLLKKQAQFISIRTSCDIGDRSVVGKSILMKDVLISIDCKIGDYVFIDAGVTIGHDVQVGDYSHIGSGVFVGGQAKIGNGVTIHPKACIAQNVKIGDGAIIGLGAVVFKDVAENQTMIGNPARAI
jgi:acetyltransferase-like isoleucine patch superfamily enzyme